MEELGRRVCTLRWSRELYVKTVRNEKDDKISSSQRDFLN